MSDTRARLKAAIADLTKLTQKIENLEAAIARASEAVELAKAEAETYAGLEKGITRWRVAQVKKGASARNLPEALAAKLEAKKAAEAEVDQAEATLAALREELTEPRRAVKPLQEAQQKAAADVLLEEHVGDLAREYSEVSARTRELGLLLHGLAHLQIEKDGRLQDVGYTEVMAEVLKAGQEFPPEVSPQADMGTRWRKRLEALLKDPAAPIARPRVIVPSDYQRTNSEAILTGSFGMRLPAEYSVRHPID